jgi:hypothetical protein
MSYDTLAPSILGRTAMTLSQRTSRRSFLAKTCRATFLATALVVTREVMFVGPRSAEAAICGGAWCGGCGYQCDNCGGSGDWTTCPSGTVKHNGWTVTCNGHTYRYDDCCKVKNLDGTCPAPCADTHCDDSCPRNSWCAGTSQPCYYCTVIATLA